MHRDAHVIAPAVNLDRTPGGVRKLRTPMDIDHATFARLLREWRDRNGYSQRDAAEVLRVSKRSLQNWEQERAMPQGFGLQAMLKVINAKGRKG
jgi:DNA-binding XRE family transcriptional regulator